MNERIKELLEQATEVHDYWYKGESVTMVNHKMFAELIIKECADYIRDNYDSWDAEPLAFNMEKDFGLHRDYA